MRARIGLSCAALAIALIQAPAHAAGGFPFTLNVTPNPLPSGATDATIVITTLPGAVCSARVRFARKHTHPIDFRPVRITATGMARWAWHELSRATGGVASASCTFGNSTETLRQTFTIARH